jgi:MYXO-CTERM domain-containing protein
VDHFGDPDTYYYEPSGGHGMQEDPAILPPEQAWDTMISFILSQSDQLSLASEFTRNESSDINQFAEAYFGWAFAMLYVPKDKYCDTYQVHIGTVDDGVQAMANGRILGYANLGDQNTTIDMVAYGTQELVLRPGINEIVLIHEDQAAVERYVTDVYLTHQGNKVPLAPKSIVWGRVMTQANTPIYQATVLLPALNDTFETGPLGFWFFAGLPDGAYDLTAQAGGYLSAGAQASVAQGAAATEVVRVDFALEPGCNCPDGTTCGSSGECLEACVPGGGEFQFTCPNDGEVCVNGYCVKDPCETIVCNAGFVCEDGTCVEIACSNVCCAAGQVCSAGQCVTDSCGAGCPTGQACAGGTCVDACSVLTCVNGLLCKDGACLPACDVDPTQCGSTGGDASSPLVDGGASTDGGSGTDGGGATGGFGGGYAGGSATGSDDSGGCGCAVPRSTGGWGAVVGLVVGVGLWLRRRRDGLPVRVDGQR